MQDFMDNLQNNRQLQVALIAGAGAFTFLCLCIIVVVGAVTLLGGGEDPTATPARQSFVTATFSTFPTLAPTLTPSTTPQPGTTIIVPTRPPLSGNAAYVAIESLNVRSGPGTSFSVVTQVFSNQAVSLLGRNNDASWVQVRTPAGIVGWVSAQFLEPNINLTSLPILVTSTATPTLTPTQSVQAALSVFPATGTVNTQVTLTGANFPVNATIFIRLGASGVATDTNNYASATTNASGAFTATFFMPERWSNGTPITSTQLRIEAIVANSAVTAQIPFAYTPATSLSPRISISPTSGGAGTAVTVTGFGFTANTPVSIMLNATGRPSDPRVFANPNTSNDGSFVTTITMPETWSNGDLIIQTEIQVVATFYLPYVASATFNYTPSVVPSQ